MKDDDDQRKHDRTVGCLILAVLVSFLLLFTANYHTQVAQPVHFGESRSSHWPTIRKDHLKKEPVCAICGSDKELQVHHILPFHLHPELELDDNNLITLCGPSGPHCHFRFGHQGNWRKDDANIRKNIEKYRQQLRSEGVKVAQ